MKKAASLFCLLLIFSAAICSCSSSDKRAAEKLNDSCELEFEILQNVEDYDFSGYQVLYGFGMTRYYGSDYKLQTNDNGNVIEEGEFVSYTVTAWPDYEDGGKYITRIFCTDQNVKVFGLTLKNSLEEFEAALSALGYDVAESDPYNACAAIVAENGGIRVSILDYGEGQGKTLTIIADVTNRSGLIF